MYKKLLIVVALVFTPLLSIGQCAMCRSSVSSTISDGRNDVGNGLNFGILYMLSFPYILVAVGIWLWYNKAKTAQLKRAILEKQLKKYF